ncbi:Hypothetical predicted protein, partial [Mytilus galloprovincialis]
FFNFSTLLYVCLNNMVVTLQQKNTIKPPSQQLSEDPNLLYDNKERDDSNDLTSWRQKFINEERNSTLSQFIKIYLCDVRNDTIQVNRHLKIATTEPQFTEHESQNNP